MKRDYNAILLPAFALVCCLFPVYLAIFRPGYLNNTYLEGLIFLEVMVAAVWRYQQRFFPLLMLVFVWAGTAFPLQGVWLTGRWLVLAVGAVAGLVVYLRDRNQQFGLMHLVALFCVVAAMVSALVSSYPKQATLKAASLLLLFLYGASGARLAVAARAERFFPALLLISEVSTYLIAVAYFVFRLEVFGSRNSLGAVMGVGVVPLLLWGILTSDRKQLRKRRILAFLLASFLLLFSVARAGIFAALLSCILLCVVLRQYKLLLKGVTMALLLAAFAATVAPLEPDVPTSLAAVFLYKGRLGDGIMASRRTPWEQTVAAIGEHPWFGSGFGTSVTQDDTTGPIRKYQTAPQAIREHGNSYLAIAEWVGLLGVAPFISLLLLVAAYTCRVFLWLRRTGNVYHVAVPTAMVLAAGLIHAMFEDWLFAVGYYLCVFFWALAFSLVDILPKPVPAVRSVAWATRSFAATYSAAVSNR